MALRFRIPREVLRQAGLRAIALIRERTLAGIDATGQPFAPYSTTPFARPLGGITQQTRAQLGGRLKIFTTQGGKKWAVVEGGYAAFKAAKRPNDGGVVNLADTFGMLRALTITKIDEGTNMVQIGFTREEEALKALYHNDVGVGASRVVRRFMGLTPANQQDVAATTAAAITVAA